MICCVCLLENPDTMGIYDEVGEKLKMAEVIRQHLWFKVGCESFEFLENHN